MLVQLALVVSTTAFTPPHVRPGYSHTHRSCLRMSLYSRGQDSGLDIDEAKVQRMVNQRVTLRDVKDFAAADALQDELKQLGVTVKDKEKIWVVDGPGKKKISPGANWRRQRQKEVGSSKIGDEGKAVGKAASGDSEAVAAPARPKPKEEPTPVAAPAEDKAAAVGNSAQSDSAEAPPPKKHEEPRAAEAAESAEEEPKQSAKERMMQLQELLDLELISAEEYDAKRKAIIDELTSGA